MTAVGHVDAYTVALVALCHWNLRSTNCFIIFAEQNRLIYPALRLGSIYRQTQHATIVPSAWGKVSISNCSFIECTFRNT
jgi:hypothetical protein